MATGLVRIAEVGFAEFTASLISQTLDAIAAAYIDQEKKIAELQTRLRQSPEEYADNVLTQAQVRSWGSSASSR